MAEPLPRLRTDLDFLPSPVPDRPGLLIRDPRQYSDATLIVPPPLVECLHHFDGESTDLDLRAHLVRMTGSLEVGELQQHLLSTLRAAGFLEDDVYRNMRAECRRRFAEAPVLPASHAGSGYPDEAEPLSETLRGYLDGAAAPPAGEDAIGIAAPHISPEGGWRMYGTAYRSIPPAYREKTFVILGTSHYGEPNRFGLTRKPFLTPLGQTRTRTELVDRLHARAGEGVEMEDYCHCTEHSIEFQVVFLQHLFGPGVRVLPILCGSFLAGPGARLPEDDDGVRRFLGELGELAAAEGDGLFWVLGIDLAHMGRRYGDPFAASAWTGPLAEVTERDRQRLERVAAGDAEGFWMSVRGRDDLKWCGAAPLYTFLRAIPGARGRVQGYEQWNIDAESVVSFAALRFGPGPR
jgi:hypothetical protein